MPSILERTRNLRAGTRKPFARTAGTLAILSLALLAAVGCVAVRPGSYLEGYRNSTPPSSGWVEVDYCGSKKGFDYFCVISNDRHLGPKSTRFKVAEGESAIDQRFPLTRDRSQWRRIWPGPEHFAPPRANG